MKSADYMRQIEAAFIIRVLLAFSMGKSDDHQEGSRQVI